MREIKVIPATSLCCKASVIGLRNCSDIENEVSKINVCSCCNNEAPKAELFKLSDAEINTYFMDLYNTKSQRIIERQELTERLKQLPYNRIK
jgi:hypothetical protein